MFAVKKVEMVNKTFRMPVELVKRLSVVAQDHSVSMNNLVSQCCDYALAHMKSPANVLTEGKTRSKSKDKE